MLASFLMLQLIHQNGCAALMWPGLILFVDHNYSEIKCVCVWRVEDCGADGWDPEVALILNSFLLSGPICFLHSNILLCESAVFPDPLPWLRQV